MKKHKIPNSDAIIDGLNTVSLDVLVLSKILSNEINAKAEMSANYLYAAMPTRSVSSTLSVCSQGLRKIFKFEVVVGN